LSISDAPFAKTLYNTTTRAAIAELSLVGAAIYDSSLRSVPIDKGNVSKGVRQWNGETPVLFHASAITNPTSREARRQKKEKIRTQIRAKYLSLNGTLDPQPPPPCDFAGIDSAQDTKAPTTGISSGSRSGSVAGSGSGSSSSNASNFGFFWSQVGFLF